MATTASSALDANSASASASSAADAIWRGRILGRGCVRRGRSFSRRRRRPPPSPLPTIPEAREEEEVASLREVQALAQARDATREADRRGREQRENHQRELEDQQRDLPARQVQFKRDVEATLADKGRKIAALRDVQASLADKDRASTAERHGREVTFCSTPCRSGMTITASSAVDIVLSTTRSRPEAPESAS